MKKIIYVAVMAIVFVACTKQKITTTTLPPKPKDLIGKEFPIWYSQGSSFQPFGMSFTQYGDTKWKMSFKANEAGIYFMPDTAVLDENGKKLPKYQKIDFSVTEYTDTVEINFPLPNKDLYPTQDRKVPTSWMSGVYLISYELVDGQRGYLLTKADGSVQIMLLDR